MQKDSKGSDILFNYQKGSGFNDVSHVMAHFDVAPIITTKQGVKIDVVEGEHSTLLESLNSLAQNPQTAWMKDFVKRSDIEWNHLQNAHKEWDYESQQLS